MRQGNSAVFLDRDGTINVEKNYLFRYEDWEWIPGAIRAIKTLNEGGFRVIVVSNQAGIARGFFTAEAMNELHEAICRDLMKEGGRIDAFYYCPHHPDFGTVRDCSCRKPRPGMIFKAAMEHNIDLGSSFLIGDKWLDMEAGLAAGVRPILVATGYGMVDAAQNGEKVPFVKDIGEACELVLNARVSYRARNHY